MKKQDLRTRAGRRAEILRQIRDHGGFSIFWITDNPVRASVGTEMIKSGEIKIDRRRSKYPFHFVRIGSGI